MNPMKQRLRLRVGRPPGNFIYVIDLFIAPSRTELNLFATQCIVYVKSRSWRLNGEPAK